MRRYAAIASVFVLSLAAGAPAVAQQRSTPVSSAPAPLGGASSGVASTEQRTPLFTALGRDIAHLPTADTAWILGIGGAAALATLPADSRLTRSAVDTPVFEETLDAGTVLGSGWIQAGGALGTLVLGRFSSSSRLESAGSDLLRAQIINVTMTQAIKFSVNRTRPNGSPYSFPSGHASASFATASVIQRDFGWKAGVLAYGAAAYASSSRLSENKHYPSDVIFGAALGLVAGRAVTVGHGAARFALVPAAAPGGAALMFTRVASD
ncbi:MAG TPA: phosphatase PAP2 family protein [Vicinamibacterales bacterium]|nr:phosphatase PAP2 family protein [Vicinamibacterales bacterium]